MGTYVISYCTLKTFCFVDYSKYSILNIWPKLVNISSYGLWNHYIIELVKVFPNFIVDDILRIHVFTLHGSCEEIIKGLFVSISFSQVWLSTLMLQSLIHITNMSLINMFPCSFSHLSTKLTILFRCEICWTRCTIFLLDKISVLVSIHWVVGLMAKLLN